MTNTRFIAYVMIAIFLARVNATAVERIKAKDIETVKQKVTDAHAYFRRPEQQPVAGENLPQHDCTTTASTTTATDTKNPGTTLDMPPYFEILHRLIDKIETTTNMLSIRYIDAGFECWFQAQPGVLSVVEPITGTFQVRCLDADIPVMEIDDADPQDLSAKIILRFFECQSHAIRLDTIRSQIQSRLTKTAPAIRG